MVSEHRQDSDRMAFAGRLRSAIQWAGYRPTDQAALGRLFGVTGQAVRKWLEGHAFPTPSHVGAIANVLGVRTAWLRDGEEPPVPGRFQVREDGPFDSLTVEPREVQLIMMWRRLGPGDRDLVLRLLQSLTGGGTGVDPAGGDPPE